MPDDVYVYVQEVNFPQFTCYNSQLLNIFRQTKKLSFIDLYYWKVCIGGCTYTWSLLGALS